MFFFFIILLTKSSAPNFIFPPLDNTLDMKERAVIFLPGGGVPIQYYNLTVQSIQQHTKLKLWVGVPNFHNTADLCDPLDPTPFGVKKKFQSTLQEIEAQAGKTFNNSEIWVFGHSLGTACAQIYFNQGFAGFVLMGGCIPNHVGFSIPAAPVMCYTGELDSGMVPTMMAYMLDNFEQTMAAKPSYRDALTSRAVTLTKQMCHLDFSPGYTNVATHFTTELPMSESLYAIGTTVSSFLHLNELPYSTSDFNVIDAAHQVAIDVLDPYRKAAKIQNTTLCFEIGQKTLANLPSEEWKTATATQNFLTVDDPFQIEHCHTACNKTDSGLWFNVSSMAEYSLGRSEFVWEGVVVRQASAVNIACKMVSRDKVGDVMGTPLDINRSCKDVNMASYEMALELMQESKNPNTLARFQKIGKTFQFIDDHKITIGPQWCISKMNWKVTDSTVTLQSQALVSPITSSIYPGNHYCKMLSPASVIEYAMSWALPHNVSAYTP